MLPMKEITNALSPEICRQRRSRALLEEALVGVLMGHQEQILDIVAAKKQKQEELCNESIDCRMRKKAKQSMDFPSTVSE